MPIIKNKIARIIFSTFIFLTFKIFAGEATLTGYGEAETPPEFITLTIRIVSECYPSATISSTTNDTLATKALEIIKSVSIKGEDEITATGGFVARDPGHYSSERQIVCANTFKKINQLQFKTKEVAKFAQTFAILQDKLYSLGMEKSSNVEAPTSYLEIFAPQPGLSLINQKTFERKALTMALQDAKEKFESTMALAGVKTYKIVKYSDEQFKRVVPPQENLDKYHRDSGAPVPAPVEFGNIIIKKQIYVKFEYTGGELNLIF